MKWAPWALAPYLGACVAAPTAPNAPAARPASELVASVPSSTVPAPELVASVPSPTVPEPLPPPALAPPPPFVVGATYEPRPSATERARELAAPPFEFETRSIEFGPQTPTLPCVIGGRPSRCVVLADGPWLVTDYEALDGCPDALHLGSAPAIEGEPAALTPAWTVRVTEQGVHGAKIAVAREAKLLAALEPKRALPSNSPRCRLTWSGHRPREARAPQPALMESPYR